MMVGNLMALRQTQVKRMLAYSSVSHMGYMLLGFGVAVGYGVDQRRGRAASSTCSTTRLMKGLAFLAAGALLYALHVSRGSHAPLTIDDLNGAASRYPMTAVRAERRRPRARRPAAALRVHVEVADLRGGVRDAQHRASNCWSMFAALNSVLSLAYYAPLVNRMYRHEPSAAVAAGQPVSWLMGAPLVVLTLAVIVLGFWPGLVDFITQPAAMHLVSIFAGGPARWRN